jgi:WD40 repeat protein
MAFNPSGMLFATVSMDKTIKIWDTEKFQLLKVIDKAKLDGHLSRVNKCLWFDDETLLTGSDDRTIMMWKMETEKM